MKLFKIPIRVDWSWLIIFSLVIWSLSTFVFPKYCVGYSISGPVYVLLGLLGALGLFASILFHELSHSIVAKRYGIPIRGITLFIFGGVAEIVDEPSDSQSEFRMAVAGPLLSFALSGLLFLVDGFAAGKGWFIGLRAVVNYLAWGNFILAVFNLIPAFPLDGGRILRAYLWNRRKNIVEATRVASKIGSGFGMAIMTLGILTFLLGNFIAGMWYFLIGMFLREAAAVSYRQIILKKSLEGERVSRFMKLEPVTVDSETTVKDLIDQYLLKYHYKVFPVVERGVLIGLVNLKDLKIVPQDEWARTRVKDHLKPISEKNSVSPNMEAREAFRIMSREGQDTLMVVEKQQLLGVLSLNDILQYLAIVYEFEESQRAA